PLDVPVVFAVSVSVSVAETSIDIVSLTVALYVGVTLTMGPFIGDCGLRTRWPAKRSGAMALGGETVTTVLSVTAGSPSAFAARKWMTCIPTSAVWGTQRKVPLAFVP